MAWSAGSRGETLSLAIVSGATPNFDPIFDVTALTHARYANRWGHVYYENRWAQSLPHPPSWEKLNAIRDAFYRGHKWVLWIDADAAFTKQADDFDVGDLVDPRFSVKVAQQTLEGIAFPCCGIMLIRNDNTGNAWLDELERRKHQYLNHPWWEQAAAYEVMGYDNTVLAAVQGDPFRGQTEWTEKIGRIPHHWHSTPQDPFEGYPMIYHATGHRDTKIRLNLLTVAIPRCILNETATQGETT